MPTVAETVKEALARKGLTQGMLAKLVGLTPPWINMIVNRGKLPGPKMTVKLADALGLDEGTFARQVLWEKTPEPIRAYLEPPKDSTGPVLSLPVIGTAAAGAAVEVAGRRGARAGAKGTPDTVGFHPDCRAIRVEGDSLEPIAYDGQYVIIYPGVRKEDIPDGSIVYVTCELAGEGEPRAMIKRIYRNRVPGDDGVSLPVYSFVPVNTHLRMKGKAPEPREAVTLRHRQVREMYPVVGVVFSKAAMAAGPVPEGGG